MRDGASRGEIPLRAERRPVRADLRDRYVHRVTEQRGILGGNGADGRRHRTDRQIPVSSRGLEYGERLYRRRYDGRAYGRNAGRSGERTALDHARSEREVRLRGKRRLGRP